MMRIFGALIALMLLSGTAHALPAENEWEQLPNTQLLPVLPTTAEMGATWCTATKSCPGQIMSVWVSLTYNSDAHKLCLVVPGGHGDAGGHSIYCINVDDAVAGTSSWQREAPPLQLDGATNPNGQCPRPANSPPGLHTYDAVPYIGDGKMLVLGGLGFCRGANMIPGWQSWVGDLTTSPPTWSELPSLEPFAKYATTAVDDQHIYILNDSRDAAILNRETLAIEQQWINNHPLDLLSGFGAMGINAGGLMCVADGSYLSCMHRDTFATVVKRPIRALAPAGSIQAALGSALAMTPLPDGRFALWNGGDMFFFTPGAGNDPALDVWERVAKPAVAPLNTSAVGGDVGRTYEKLFYIPHLNVLAAVVNTKEGVWFYGLPPIQQGNFEERRNAPGVIFSQGFDTDIAESRNLSAAEGVGINAGLAGLPSTSLPRVENGALRFDVLSGGSAASAGQYWVQFPELENIFVQWRQFIPEEVLHTEFAHTNGRDLTSFKMLILSDSGTSSCTSNHIVVVKDNWAGPYDTERGRGSLALYHACGYYDQVSRAGPSVAGSTLFDAQPVIPEADQPAAQAAMIAASKVKPVGQSTRRGCWHNGYDRSGCVEMRAGVWVTYQVARETIGPDYWIGARVFTPSRLRLWQQIDGEELVLVIDSVQGMRDVVRRWGRAWFLPYMTNKDATQVHPDTYTLVDEVIVSSQRIPDWG